MEESYIKFFSKQLNNGFTHMLILWIISKNKIHGYGISKELTNFLHAFEGCEVNPAKIYPILKKMEDGGLVESEEDFLNNKKVKFYKITDKGLDVLNYIKEGWTKLVHDDLWIEFFHDMTDSYSIGDEK